MVIVFGLSYDFTSNLRKTYTVDKLGLVNMVTWTDRHMQYSKVVLTFTLKINALIHVEKCIHNQS